jgi:hypothetical protein
MQMKTMCLILCLITSAWAQQNCPIENGWKGIKLFQTTRSEVEKILGVPSEKINNVFTSYRTKEALIHFAYSHAPCTDEGRGRFAVPRDTVISYWVVLNDGITLSDFKWQEDRYERIDDPHMKGNVIYGNLKDGISFTTNRKTGVETIEDIRFDPTLEMNSKFLCKEYK